MSFGFFAENKLTGCDALNVNDCNYAKEMSIDVLGAFTIALAIAGACYGLARCYMSRLTTTTSSATPQNITNRNADVESQQVRIPPTVLTIPTSMASYGDLANSDGTSNSSNNSKKSSGNSGVNERRDALIEANNALLAQSRTASPVHTILDRQEQIEEEKKEGDFIAIAI